MSRAFFDAFSGGRIVPVLRQMKHPNYSDLNALEGETQITSVRVRSSLNLAFCPQHGGRIPELFPEKQGGPTSSSENFSNWLGRTKEIGQWPSLRVLLPLSFGIMASLALLGGARKQRDFNGLLEVWAKKPVPLILDVSEKTRRQTFIPGPSRGRHFKSRIDFDLEGPVES